MRLFFIVVLLILIGVEKMKWFIIIGLCIVGYLMFKEPAQPVQQVVITSKAAIPVVPELTTVERIQAWLVEHTPKK